jgi:hypothetical protein
MRIGISIFIRSKSNCIGGVMSRKVKTILLFIKSRREKSQITKLNRIIKNIPIRVWGSGLIMNLARGLSFKRISGYIYPLSPIL